MLHLQLHARPTGNRPLTSCNASRCPCRRTITQQNTQNEVYTRMPDPKRSATQTIQRSSDLERKSSQTSSLRFIKQCLFHQCRSDAWRAEQIQRYHTLWCYSSDPTLWLCRGRRLCECEFRARVESIEPFCGDERGRQEMDCCSSAVTIYSGCVLVHVPVAWRAWSMHHADCCMSRLSRAIYALTAYLVERKRHIKSLPLLYYIYNTSQDFCNLVCSIQFVHFINRRIVQNPFPHFALSSKKQTNHPYRIPQLARPWCACVWYFSHQPHSTITFSQHQWETYIVPLFSWSRENRNVHSSIQSIGLSGSSERLEWSRCSWESDWWAERTEVFDGSDASAGRLY